MNATVVIATIPPRREMLERAVASVLAQTVQCDLAIAVDREGVGGGATRNRAQKGVTTEWTALLDDDDELYTTHVEKLLHLANQTGADLVYPLYEGCDSIPVDERGYLHHMVYVNSLMPITVLVRTDLVQEAGGFQEDELCYEWQFWIRLLKAGAKFSHLPEVTWRWNVHDENTLGRSWK